MSKNKKSIIWTIVLLPVLILTTFLGFVWYVFKATTQLTNNEKSSLKKAKEKWHQQAFDSRAFFEKYPSEIIALKSGHGDHQIPMTWFYQDISKKRDRPTIIAVHGLGGNRYTILPVVEKFLERGYNVIIYDQRSSGENYARYTTFGYLEKFDLMDVLAFVAPYIKSHLLGLWGESFGGGTVGLALSEQQVEETVDFAIMDCPVDGLEWYIKQDLLEKHFPKKIIDSIVYTSNWLNHKILHYHYDDLNVSQNINELKRPVLVVRTLADELTPAFMGEAIYEAIENDNKILWTVKDSAHVKIRNDYPDQYWALVDEVVQRANQPQPAKRLYTI